MAGGGLGSQTGVVTPGFVMTAVFVGVFAVTHLVLASEPVREWIVDRIGSVKFAVLFSMIAWAGLGATLMTYAAHRHEGPMGLGWDAIPWCRGLAIGLMVAGAVLMVAIAAPTGYVASSVAVFTRYTDEPRGLERVTRHPFFAGLALYCVGHILVAQRLIGIVVFGTFGVLAVLGGLMQDRKMVARRGEQHAEYLRASSFLPFWAVVRGRQRIVWSELPWLFLVLGGAGAWGIRLLHGTTFAANYGAYVVFGVMVVVPSWFAFQLAFKHHRARSSL